MKITKRIRTKITTVKTISVGGDVTDSIASLQIYSPTIDIVALTKALGCAPTEAHKKNDPAARGKSRATVNLWRLEAPDHLSLAEKIRYLVDATTSDLSTWHRIAATHRVELRCAIFLHSWSEGFDLPSTLVAELGSRLWQFGLTAYSAEGDEIVDAFLADAGKTREKNTARPNQRLHPTAPAAKVKRRG